MGLVRSLGTPLAAALLAVPVLAGCGSSGSPGSSSQSRYGEASAGDITLSDGWATEAPKAPAGSEDPTDMSSTMASVSGAYFTLTNDSDSDDALVAVSTPAAAQAQLHATESTAGGSSATMKQVARIPVPAAGTTRLEIGGYHVMLVRPTRALTAGDRVPVELRFSSGATLDARLPVLEREDRPR